MARLSGEVVDQPHGARRGEALGIPRGVGGDGLRCVEPGELITEGPEVEEASELREDVVRAGLDRMASPLPGEVVPQLILPRRGLLRGVRRGPRAVPAGENHDGIVGHPENLVREILKVRGELIQLVPADVERVVRDEVVHVVRVGAAAAEVGRRGARDLVVDGRVLLQRVPVEHRLVLREPVIDLAGEEGVVIRGRNRGHRVPPRYGRELSDRIGTDRGLPLRFIEPLQRPEEEQVVATDRPAHGPAVLPALEALLGCTALLEEVARREVLVAIRAEGRSPEGVRARLGDDVHDTTHRPAALRRPAVLQDLELLDRLVREVLKQAPDNVVLVVAAVHVHVELAAIATAHRHVPHARLRRVEVPGRARLGHDDREVGKRAVQQRKVGDLRRRDDAAEIRSGCLDQGGGACDDERFRHVAHLELHGKRLAGADVDRDILPFHFPEPGKLRGHHVAAGGQQDEQVVAGVVGRGGTGETRFVAADGHRDSRDHRAGRVCDPPRDFAARCLRAGVRRAEAQQHRQSGHCEHQLL